MCPFASTYTCLVHHAQLEAGVSLVVSFGTESILLLPEKSMGSY